MLQVKHSSDKPTSVTVTDHGYRSRERTKTLGPRQEVDIPLKSSQSHGWYDFTVAIKDPDTTVRYAGRVETGASSLTDPVMGDVAVSSPVAQSGLPETIHRRDGGDCLLDLPINLF